MSSATADPWLAATKIRVPARRRDALRRTRLCELAERGLSQAKLTLVSAPAGAGKTSLLAELAASVPTMRWAWLALDEEDNDPWRFSAGVAASLERSARMAFDVQPGPEGEWFPRQIAAGIVNRCVQLEGPPVALVLDDLHTVENESVHQALDYLIDRLPPNLRIVAGTRHDPPLSLARLRARGELAEIRLTDLTFTEEETAELAKRLDLDLDAGEVRELFAATEGWAAGIRLLAGSLASRGEGRQSLVEPVRRGKQPVFEFLLDEVFGRQPPHLQRFLLQTSVFSSLLPEACGALTGRADAEQILEALYRRNLFVAVADEDRTQYRYHDLFADFLRDRLRREAPGEWLSMHRRAAVIETNPASRIRHWISGANWSEAAAEIERIGAEYLERGFSFTLRRWIQEIPSVVRRERPRLALLLGSSIWVRSELHEAEAYFEEALEGYRRLGDPGGQGESLVALSITANMAGRHTRAADLFQEALQYPLPAGSRLDLHAATGWDALNRRDWEGMNRNLEELLELASRQAAGASPFALVLLVYGTSFPGFLDRLHSVLSGNYEHFASFPDFSRVYWRVLWAACQQFRGDLAGSLATAAEVAEMASQSEPPLIVRLSIMVTRILTAYSRGDWGVARAVSEQMLEDQMMEPFVRRWRTLAAYFRGRACWLAGDTAGAEASYLQIESPEAGEAPQAQVYRLLHRGILELSRRQWSRARDSFENALRMEDEYPISAGSSSALVLLAHVHFKRGAPEDALECFLPYLEAMERLNGPGYLLRENPIVAPLLRLAHQRGRHRAFAGQVLGLMNAPLVPAASPGAEPLSARELEVLRVLVEGAGNREIAGRLFISETTVKTHVQRILRKLNAASRAQAAARARELMLV